MIRSILTGGLAALALMLGGSAWAQSGAQSGPICTQADIAAVIAGMSETLKKANADSQARLQSKLRELAKLKGWSEAETEEKGLELLEDDETRIQDETASHLLGMVDKLGQSGDTAPACTQIGELKAVATQLVEVTGARSAHMSAKLDNELKSARPAVAAQVPLEPKKVTPPPRATARPAWETQTTSRVPQPNEAYTPPEPAPVPPPAAVVEPIALEFTPDDIRAAGSGFFGTISAEFAALVEYLFKSYGRPTGYILGTEGGAALLAGLRYGEGTFVTKRGGERKIYWQGPSVGSDLGLTGSRTMILIYNLASSDDILQRFIGVDGSAYFVGGAGVTVLKKGPIILAPIRTGLGLRLGASIGYLRFTASPRFSPF